MRNMVAVLAALSLIAGLGLSGDASAQPHKKKSHKHAHAQAGKSAAYRAAPLPDPYIERDSNRLPFGSAIWWDQMLRENRAGPCCN